MRVLICSKDAEFFKQLYNYLKLFFRNIHIKSQIEYFENEELLFTDAGSKDMLFLDIDTLEASGIRLGNKLKRTYKELIIFVLSSNSEYWDSLMYFHTFCFITKPLNKNSIFKSLKEKLELYCTTIAKIGIETKKGIYTVPVKDILMFEVIERNAIVYTNKGNFKSVHSLSFWLNQLPKNVFFQTHRSYIVNMEHVDKFDTSLVYMDNGTNTAYLTKRKYGSFKTAYLFYLKMIR